MKLHIENIAKIQNTEILIDGITVIVGKNNVGKSTVGKALYCMFSALSDIERKIARERVNYLRQAIYSLSFKVRREGKALFGIYAEKYALRIYDTWKENKKLSRDDVREMLISILHEIQPSPAADSQFADDVELYSSRVADYLKVDDDQVIGQILTDTFREVFNDQVNTLSAPEHDGIVRLMIRNKELKAVFRNNECVDKVLDIDLLNKAVFIDDPSVMEGLSNVRKNTRSSMERTLVSYMREAQFVRPGEDVIERTLNKNKLKDIYSVINEAVDGSFVERNGELCFQEKDHTYAIKLNNLSYGLKSFVQLKYLLERNILKRGDVLIFDEPEIHLHPQWQILFARLVVLLQREFELSVIVTSHSYFFVDAIDLYTQKYGTASTAHFYVAEENSESASFHEVTHDPEDLYLSTSDAANMLEQLRDSM